MEMVLMVVEEGLRIAMIGLGGFCSVLFVVLMTQIFEK